jgi:hypothetical protein
VIAGFIFGEKYQTVVAAVGRMLHVCASASRDKKVHPNDGFDVALGALFVEFNRPVHIAVVGKRECCMTIGFCRRNEVFYFGHRLEE